MAEVYGTLNDMLWPSVTDDIYLELSGKTATLRKRGSCGGWGYDFSKGEFVSNYYTYADHGAVREHFHVPTLQALEVALMLVVEKADVEGVTPRRDWLETLHAGAKLTNV